MVYVLGIYESVCMCVYRMISVNVRCIPSSLPPSQVRKWLRLTLFHLIYLCDYLSTNFSLSLPPQPHPIHFQHIHAALSWAECLSRPSSCVPSYIPAQKWLLANRISEKRRLVDFQVIMVSSSQPNMSIRAEVVSLDGGKQNFIH